MARARLTEERALMKHCKARKAEKTLAVCHLLLQNLGPSAEAALNLNTENERPAREARSDRESRISTSTELVAAAQALHPSALRDASRLGATTSGE